MGASGFTYERPRGSAGTTLRATKPIAPVSTLKRDDTYKDIAKSPLYTQFLRGPENVDGFRSNYLAAKAHTVSALDITVKKPPMLPKVLKEVFFRPQELPEDSKNILLAAYANDPERRSQAERAFRQMEELAACRKSPGACYQTEEVFRVMEDMRIVHDVSRGIDGQLKGMGIKQGLAIVSAPGLVLIEHEQGSVTDLKIALNLIISKQAMRIYKYRNHVPTIGSLLDTQLPIPVKNTLLYGTWSRPSIVSEDLHNPVSRLNVSLVEATVDEFIVNDKKHPGFWCKDITEEVQNKITELGKKNGHVVITTPHTTIGIKTLFPGQVEPLHKSLIEIAPAKPGYYYHDIIDGKGALVRDNTGKPLGDGNGQSHVMASLIGSYEVLPFKNGRLQLLEKRIFHIDCDTLEPRKRHVVISIIGA